MDQQRDRIDWASHLKTQSESGLSIAEYARRHELSLKGFYYQRRLVRIQDLQQSEPSFSRVRIVEHKKLNLRAINRDRYSLEISLAELNTILGFLLNRKSDASFF